ncbi:MAG: hypothetical protein AAB225_04070 [Acidobacteriota bacterium]
MSFSLEHPTRRAFAAVPLLAAAASPAQSTTTLSLDGVRRDMLAYCEGMRDTGGPYGCYRGGPGKRTDLYSSCDIAILRTLMGEDLARTLTPEQRTQWIAHITSYVDRSDPPYDGSYSDTHGHSKLHANGMVLSALGALGGRQIYPVRLYDAFRRPDRIAAWLDRIDWSRQWRASHLFWGGMICFSLSRHCTPAWLDRVFAWLDANLDERTGWWRKGVPHSDRHQPLGGSVHILPLYEHHHRKFPYPERVIDSVLALQLESGRWQEMASPHVMGYLELDALYALALMQQHAPGYRHADIQRSAGRYGSLAIRYYREHSAELYRLHPHNALAAGGTFGLLSRMAPKMFPASNKWTDIFSDPRFYNTRAVEAEG